MKPPKLGLIILILGGVALGTYFLAYIFKSSTNQSPTLSSSIKLSSPAPQPAPSLGNFDEKNNLTKNFGDTLYKQIQTEIQTGNLPTNANSLSEELANKVINNSLSDFQLISTINDSDLKISPDISREAKNQYLKTLGEINVKDFGDFKENYLQIIIDTYQKLNYTSAAHAANIYKNLANDYLNLTVPKDWVDVHKRLIIYVKNTEIIYRAMANYPTDPIKGYLALESIDSWISNAQEIQAILGEKIKEVALK